ncbi:MAG: bifunctional 3,4-dihydroxy-2-butanone 4-phosphate synthase/GTP cyclohydrolase II [Helicobacter sp.]|uniref:bifunctional 3,4-dihydroxy-2-butanone 4-phosphate synthase/GTP cyclohydrolase II n=1 Tax=Helicobacter sp. TaxID=218 RepID=UPI0025C578BC|nr:bifunctional 3,4-dihydroxy-2-butanone 4-phosphate synthase/GTP cyclohydrolase II [Helicobacter sp.]MCH5312989.1 bifunctional 3,4-dihydroxy-2-butanone 4-phosphate synthase/GTP cyclohydrolase II [Helicobacter sp.]
MYQQRVKEAIEAIKKGEMIIIMDDEDRENEGDLVMAGIFSSPQKINFMAQEARGLICVSITQDIAKKLDLPPMVQKNDSNHETAFTISIDAKEAKTGISAYERDLTIRLMCDSNTKPSDFVRPGHIFPLIAKEGGVLVRTGHTEASVDICKLAGVAPISVICEIMKKDGTMAGRGDKFLLDFAKAHDMKILYVSDIIQYRLNFENLLSERSREKAVFMGKKCEKITFIDHLEREHTAFSFTVSSQNKPLVRFHNVRSDVELLQNAEEWNALSRSVEYLTQKGGYLIVLNTQALSASAARICGDMKDFGIGAQILKRLGVEDFSLLSSCGTNRGEYNALSGFNLHLVETIEV